MTTSEWIEQSENTQQRCCQGYEREGNANPDKNIAECNCMLHLKNMPASSAGVKLARQERSEQPELNMEPSPPQASTIHERKVQKLMRYWRGVINIPKPPSHRPTPRVVLCPFYANH